MQSEVDRARELIAREAAMPLGERLALWRGRRVAAAAWYHECAVAEAALESDLKVNGIVKAPAPPEAARLPELP